MDLGITESLAQPWGNSPLRPPTGASGINVIVDEPFSSSVTIGSATPARNGHSSHKMTPHSPGAQLLLNAAGVVSPRSLDLASFPASMLESPGTDIFAGLNAGILPPSPAMTPSRLFLSESAPLPSHLAPPQAHQQPPPPQQQQHQPAQPDQAQPEPPQQQHQHQQQQQASTFTALSTDAVALSPYTDALLMGSSLSEAESVEDSPQSEGDVGSIHKNPHSLKRKMGAQGTARRPLLQMTPQARNGHSNEHDPAPLSAQQYNQLTPSSSMMPSSAYKVAKSTPSPPSTPLEQASKSSTSTPSTSSGKKAKKDRKAYSTAGRPRKRGEYKCGKCGFMPKKGKHSCAEFTASLKKANKRGKNSGFSSGSRSTPYSPLANPIF